MLFWFFIFLGCTLIVCLLMATAPEMALPDDEAEELLHSLREAKRRRPNSLHYVPLPDLQTPKDAVRV